jgi:hypothetical protein
MKWPSIAILPTCIVLASCGNMYSGVYEGNKSYKDSYKTPVESAMTPTPGYREYKQESDKLKQVNPVTEKDESPEFNLK